MASIKRLGQIGQNTLDTSMQALTTVSAPSVDAQLPRRDSSTLDELENMLSGGAPAPVPTPEVVAKVSAAETAPADRESSANPPSDLSLGDRIDEIDPPSMATEPAPSPRTERAALDYLNILKSLAPVFKAATIFPGHEADPAQISAAVRKMSQVSVELADYIVANGDHLELDAAWARKSLHSFTAELVASHWIATVIGMGGVMAGQAPSVSVEFFTPAIQVAMNLPIVLPRQEEDARLFSFNGAVQLALIEGVTPLAVEVEKFATIITAKIPSATVSVDSLVAEVGQFIMEQALFHYGKFMADAIDATDDDQKAMLQALIQHVSEVMISSWEYCRGEVLGALKDAASEEAAAAILAQSQFTYGFPLQALKTRAEESIKRVAGTALYAMSMLRQSKQSRGV
jgi:hypothetical protein